MNVNISYFFKEDGIIAFLINVKDASYNLECCMETSGSDICKIHRNDI